MKRKEDSNGTVHEYEYDGRGRLVQDEVTTVGTGIDGTVRRIGLTYHRLGGVEAVTSYNSTSGVVNEVKKTYNAFGQLTVEEQSHSGTANGTKPKVEYDYEDGSANTLRPVSMTYPNDRVIEYNYGADDEMDDILSRVQKLVDGPSTSLASYTYLGAGRLVEQLYHEPVVKLTYLKQIGDPNFPSGDPRDPGDQYTGLDRFGRLQDQRWLGPESSSSSSSSSSSGPEEGAWERVQWGFDRAGNRTWRKNLVAPNNHPQDELYTSDGLYQLATFARGLLNGDRTELTDTPKAEEEFTYDPQGNWAEYHTAEDGDPTLDQTREHNTVNEITAIDNGEIEPAVAHDAAGNMTTVPKPGDWGTSYTLQWDAWNRLVKVSEGETVVAEYAYDGQTRRITKTTGGTMRHYYYSSRWQVLEERLDTNTTADRQFVWGLRHVDDLLLRDRSLTGGNQRLYALHDHLSVTAVVGQQSGNWTVLERYGYTAFGETRVMDAGFAEISASQFDWETRLHAYRWDGETGLYQVRYRSFDSPLGRWLSRDPLREPGFQAVPRTSAESFWGVLRLDELPKRSDLYFFVRNNSLNYADRNGLGHTLFCAVFAAFLAAALVDPRNSDEYLAALHKRYAEMCGNPPGTPHPQRPLDDGRVFPFNPNVNLGRLCLGGGTPPHHFNQPFQFPEMDPLEIFGAGLVVAIIAFVPAILIGGGSAGGAFGWGSVGWGLALRRAGL